MKPKARASVVSRAMKEILETGKLNRTAWRSSEAGPPTHPALLVLELHAVDGDVEDDALLVRAGLLHGHLGGAHGVRAHGVAARLAHVLLADQLSLEVDAVALEAERVVLGGV